VPGADIAAAGLSKAYGGQAVFEGLSFSVSGGKSLALLGPSGCGKTTILNILQGLAPPDSGTVEFTPRRAARSLVMQDHGLFPWKTAWKNLELPLLLAGAPAAERAEKVGAMLAGLGLSGLGGRWPQQLSGGQRQRLALGRSLIMSPELLFLDEPFSSLDALTREGLENLLISLWKSLRVTMVLSTHSVEEAVLLGDSILVLGGSPSEVVGAFDNPGAGGPGARDSEESSRLARRVRSALRGGAPGALANRG
jgi:NitT/TauT family transport system ATP-binding protein